MRDEVRTVQKDEALLQSDASAVQKHEFTMRKNAASVQTDTAPLQKKAADLQKGSAPVQKDKFRRPNDAARRTTSESRDPPSMSCVQTSMACLPRIKSRVTKHELHAKIDTQFALARLSNTPCADLQRTEVASCSCALTQHAYPPCTRTRAYISRTFMHVDEL